MAWDNPIWTYRIRWRWWRRLSPRTRWIVAAAALAIGAASSLTLAIWTAQFAAAQSLKWYDCQHWYDWYRLYSVVALVWAGICGAAAIAPERRRGTWDALIVSSLSPRDIILGKFAAAVLPVVLFGVWTLPAWCALYATQPAWFITWMSDSPSSLLWTCLRAVGRPFPFAALGLYVSFRARSPVVAFATTMALVAPILLWDRMSLSTASYVTWAVPRFSLQGMVLELLLHWTVLPPTPPDLLPNACWVLAILADLVWIILIPSLLLGHLITRFDHLDRKVRGDIRGRGAGSHEPTAKDQVQDPSP